MVFPTRSLLLLSVITGVKAFVPPKPPVAPSTVLLMQREERVSSQGLTQFFGIFAAAAILSFPLEATARDVPLASSSVQLADAVKTLDMSLPSYSDLKDSKSSIENVPSLSVAPSAGGGSGISRSQRKAGMPVSSVLPSMGKKSAKAKAAEKAARQAPSSSGKMPEYDF